MLRYGVCRNTVVRWITVGYPSLSGPIKLPAEKVGRPYRILESDLAEFLQKIQGKPVVEAEPFKGRAISVAKERAALDRVLAS